MSPDPSMNVADAAALATAKCILRSRNLRSDLRRFCHEFATEHSTATPSVGTDAAEVRELIQGVLAGIDRARPVILRSVISGLSEDPARTTLVEQAMQELHLDVPTPVLASASTSQRDRRQQPARQMDRSTRSHTTEACHFFG